jgi:hypothetical protein
LVLTAVNYEDYCRLGCDAVECGSRYGHVGEPCCLLKRGSRENIVGIATGYGLDD